MPGNYNHFIKNEWHMGLGPTFSSHNPATGEIVWQGASAYETDVHAATTAARESFQNWSSLPLESRIQYLKSFGDIINKEKNHLAEIISIESGKPLWDSKGEVAAMINKIDISIEAYHNRCPELRKDLSAALLVTRHRPHGVVAVFGPYNFPGHLPNGHIVPALLAGNTVVWKPSEYTPLVGEEIIKCWLAAMLPAGVINLIQGGHETGRYLAQSRNVDGLFFTGSWNTGKILSEQLAGHPEKILALEMGGNNPLVVGQVGDLTAAAYITIQSAFLSSGQRCTCARRLIVPRGTVGDSFVQELSRMIRLIKVGPYTSLPEPFMGPVINAQAAAKLLGIQDYLESKGGLAIALMELVNPGTGLLTPGLMDVTKISNRPDEEYFGPFLQLIRVDDFRSAISEANNTAYGLAAGLLSDSDIEYKEFYGKVRAGVVNWNAPLTGASSFAPFGGIGHSGNHRPSAYYAADYCCYPVASMEANQLKLPSSLVPGIHLEKAKSEQ